MYATTVKPNKRSIDSKYTPWTALSPTGPERDPRCDSLAVQKLSLLKHLNPNLISVLIPCKIIISSQFPIQDFQQKQVKSVKTGYFFEKALRMNHKTSMNGSIQ